MFLMLSKSTNGAGFLVLLLTPMFCVYAAESDFDYFSNGIDFWNERKAAEPEAKSIIPLEKKPPEAQVSKAQPEKEPFQWETYLNPKNKEFFKEGDYSPPEPFMELVRNPTDENLKMWFAYVERKNELALRLQQRMNEYLAKNGTAIPEEQRKRVASLESQQNKAIDMPRYRLRMYFNSKCPHCQKMFGTLSELQSQGFFVEAKQIDPENGTVRSLPFPSEPASPGEVKQKNIQSVPLLLIGDLKKKVVYRLTGFQTTTDVLKAIRSQDSGS